jgi:hypothetical protein
MTSGWYIDRPSGVTFIILEKLCGQFYRKTRNEILSVTGFAVFFYFPHMRGENLTMSKIIVVLRVVRGRNSAGGLQYFGGINCLKYQGQSLTKLHVIITQKTLLISTKLFVSSVKLC